MKPRGPTPSRSRRWVRQHGQGGVRQAALEGVAEHEMPLAVREGLHLQVVGRGDAGVLLLRLQPFAHVVGQLAPAVLVVDEAPDALSQIGGEWGIWSRPSRRSSAPSPPSV